jgi:hypothetical protein
MLSRAAGGVWNGTWVPYGISHGADIRFQYKQKSITVRYLENRPLSLNYHRALINELVTDPKTDYNGGGWTGADGGGLIDSSDEWIELVNTDDSPLSVSNYFLLYRTANGESVKELGVRYNPCFSKKSETLSNYNYIVLAPETGLANSASIGLYEGYPWLEGKLLDELDYGTDNFSGGDAWMNAPGGESSGKEDEAVVRIPNAVYDKRYRDVFRKGRASFAGMNSDGQPLLWARNVIGSFSNTVYLSEAGNTNSTLEVKVRNDLDSEVLTLTNYGIFFMGVINITNAEGAGNDGVLNVKNGIMSTVFYNNSINGKETTTRFAWAQEGWHLPEESPGVANVIMYPNPAVALRRTKIVFANLPDDAEVSVIDPFGNLVGKSNNFDKGYGFMSWEAELKKGIYVAVIRSGPRIVSKKLLVR